MITYFCQNRSTSHIEADESRRVRMCWGVPAGESIVTSSVQMIPLQQLIDTVHHSFGKA